MNNIPVITIDGPSGTGKGTISQLLAKQLKWHLLDSGALYRILAFVANKNNIAVDNIDVLKSLASTMDVSFKASAIGEPAQVYLGNENISTAIRTEACGKLASQIAQYPTVREALLGKQYAFRQMPGLIADGRDMGTVVFPDAHCKIYLTASPARRIKRRYQQLLEQGNCVNLAQLEADIVARDKQDREREFSPLKPAKDSHIIDTSDLSIQQVLDKVLYLAKSVIGS